jgi:NADH pyrophosphatase NudC (nudix superfamily)
MTDLFASDFHSTYCRVCGSQINYRYSGYQIECSNCKTLYDVKENGLFKVKEEKK